MLSDAHIHLADLLERDPSFPERLGAWARGAGGWECCAACHSRAEWDATESLRPRLPPFVSSLGMHPQAPDLCEPAFLEETAASGALAAIGEAGFDFFGDRPQRVRNRENEIAQRAAFEFQLSLADRLGLPLVLHLRKAMDLAFEYAPRLRRLRGVVFHSYPGTAAEAESLLRRGVPAYFSFGASTLNGNKRAAAACAAVPGDRLLAETDAPWQPPRRPRFEGPDSCRPEDLAAVIAGIASIRGEGARAIEDAVAANFAIAFGRE